MAILGFGLGPAWAGCGDTHGPGQGMDGGADAAPDAAFDGGADGGADAAPDAAPDGRVDAGLDATPDEPADGGADAAPDGAPDSGSDAAPPPSAAGTPVDVLFVVDNSGSMTEEQEALAEQLPRFVRSLVTGELRDPVTEELRGTFDPADDLHLGVVSTDMGTGGHFLDTCLDSARGDDGVLLDRVAADCEGRTLPRFLSFSPGDDPLPFANAASCKVRLGTNGCGFEQPLEAMLKALLPANAESTLEIEPFVIGTGHADGANAGFLRDDSILLVVLLTDEDDCSVQDTALFDPLAFGGPTTLNVRCATNPDALFAVERFARGLLSVRAGAPHRLLFVALAGLPPDLGTAEDGATDWERIACTPERIAAGTCDERLRPEVVGTRMGQQLRTSCDVPGRGVAFPPNRIMRLGELLERGGAGVVAGSICGELDGPVDLVLRRLASLRR